MTRRNFRLGQQEIWGQTTCSYGLGDLPGDACTQLATIHVYWFEDNATSPTCDEHLQFIKDNTHLTYETHTFGPNCGMPGTLWHHPYTDEDEGYCLFPGPDDPSLLVEEPVPAAERTR